MPPVDSTIPVLAHTPTPSLLPTPGPGTDDSAASGSQAGAIAGALVGVMLVVVVAVLVVLLVVLVSRKRQMKNLPAVNTDERELERVLDNPIYGGTVPQKHLYLSVSTCTGLWYNESLFFPTCNVDAFFLYYYIIIQEGVMTTPMQLLVRNQSQYPTTSKHLNQTAHPWRTNPSMTYQYINSGVFIAHWSPQTMYVRWGKRAW